MTRITGLATGLDVDSVVKETMQAYQTKIDTVDQQKKVAELQQEMYRDVIKECRNFYDDYFDISKSDSILLQRNWGTTTFESSNSAVSVTGNGGAEVAKYSVEVTSLAKAASYTVDPDKLNGTIYVNNVKVELGTDKTTEEKVKLINSALKGKGVTAKYSDFEKGIVIKTEKLGSDQSITLGGSKTIDEDSDFFTKKVDEYKNSVNKDTRDEKKEIFEFEYNGKKITDYSFSWGNTDNGIEKAVSFLQENFILPEITLLYYGNEFCEYRIPSIDELKNLQVEQIVKPL